MHKNNFELVIEKNAIFSKKPKLGIIGLGYVGLPLAVEFGKKFNTVGFDVNKSRIDDLNKGIDKTLECSLNEIKEAIHLIYSHDKSDLRDCNVYIVTVPTPIDQHKKPDLTPLLDATLLVASLINKNDIIVYESTVYPGATEEECVPILEARSGLRFNVDFFVGYSPERINPGDKQHRLTSILKVTSGSTPEASDFIDNLYKSIINVGTYKASSIKVAEAAKVIENTQRDVNIALINELSIIFNKLGVDTSDVLEAAGTKWNFLPFRPGLVGGHCIGVDPYYLTHKAQSIGYHPEMILAGRRLNDGMAHYIVSQLIKSMLKKKIQIVGSNMLIMGFTFKENCPDLRNTKVIDIISELSEYGVNVEVIDPWCSVNEAQIEYNVTISPSAKNNFYDAAVIAVAHEEFKSMGFEKIKSYMKSTSIIYDLKYVLNKDEADLRL